MASSLPTLAAGDDGRNQFKLQEVVEIEKERASLADKLAED